MNTIKLPNYVYICTFCISSLSVNGQWLSVDVWDCGYSRWQLPIWGLLPHGSECRCAGTATGGQRGRGGGRVRQPPFFHTTPWGNGGSLRKTLFQRGEIELLLLPEHVQHLYLQVGKSWVFKPLTRTITPVWFEEVLNWQNTLTYLRIRISDISQYGMHVCILNNSSIVAVVCHVVIHFTITVTLWWSNLCWELS